jgi:N-acetylneuraminic acid mutarotase
LAHQVFVSYATEDAEAASRVCAMLEADGIRCWIAPRDVKAGTDYAASIMNAIRTSNVALLVFSAHSNASPYALREIERAFAYGRPVLALAVDGTDPNSSLEYYVHGWIEASGGVEGKRAEFLTAVREQLARSSAADQSSAGVSASIPGPMVGVRPSAGEARRGPRRWYRTIWAVAGAVVILAAAIGLGLGFGLTRGDPPPQDGAMSDQISWIELKPSGTPPPARYGHSIASIGGRLIVFGGSTASVAVGDMWAYDSAADAWEPLKPSGTAPSARSGHAMAYDQAAHRLILFGGLDNTAAPLDDTWAYDPVADTWTELDPSGGPPLARIGHSMVYDPVARRSILFGGSTRASAALGDIWAYDAGANSWTELQPKGRVPSARTGHSAAYDQVTHRLMVFGGVSDMGAFLNETWAYNPAANAWTELHPKGELPSPRAGHSMAYDPIRGILIMFGGQDSSGNSLDDTWAYDGGTNAWAALQPSGAQPRARAGQAMANDAASGRLIMFGGRLTPYDLVDETWTCAAD